MQATCCPLPPNKLSQQPRCYSCKAVCVKGVTPIHRLECCCCWWGRQKKSCLIVPSCLLSHCHVVSHSFWCGRRRHIQPASFPLQYATAEAIGEWRTVATTRQWTCATCNQSQMAHGHHDKTVCNVVHASRVCLRCSLCKARFKSFCATCLVHFQDGDFIDTS